MRLMGSTIMVLFKCFLTAEKCFLTAWSWEDHDLQVQMNTGVLGKIVAWDCVTKGTGIAGIEKWDWGMCCSVFSALRIPGVVWMGGGMKRCLGRWEGDSGKVCDSRSGF